MATRKVITTETVEVARAPVPHLPNSNASLRAIFLWIDDATGHTITVDSAVIGWFLTAPRPMPITPVGDPPEAQTMVIYDREEKHWTGLDGRVFKEWRHVEEQLFRQWAARHPDHINARSVQPKEAPPLTTPSVGGIGLASGDHWGTGQEPPSGPKPWKPGR